MESFWLLPMAFALWKVVSASMVMRVHRDDADDKLLLIPGGDPSNPLVAQAGALRKRATRTRMRWIGIGVLSAVALFGGLQAGTAMLLCVLWYGIMKVLG